MKAIKLTLITVAAAFAVFADGTPASTNAANHRQKSHQLTPEKLEQLQMKRFGGFVCDTRNQRGSIVIVNSQKAADTKWFDPVLYELRHFLKVRFEVKEGAFSFPNPELKGEACVFVVDDPALPMSLAAPEAGWTMCNVAPLKSGEGTKPQFFQARVQKLLMRSFSYLMGAANSQYPMCICGCVTKPEDLDRFTTYRLPIDLLGKFEKYVAGYGVLPYTYVTYRKSVQEGWGAQPTNDYQKAIWDKVHKLPTNPLPLVKPTK